MAIPVAHSTAPLDRLRIPELDGVRGLMAWWVVVVHSCEFAGYLRTPGFNVLQGVEAVRVFIILSGFVIFHLLETGRENYITFIFRRFLRLFPVYVLALGVAVALAPVVADNCRNLIWLQGWRAELARASYEHFGEHLTAHLLMLHGLIPDTLLPLASVTLLGPAWSISLEWQFYLVAPLFYLVAQSPTRRTTLICVLAIIPILTPDGLPYVTPSFLPLSGSYFFVGAASYALFRRGWQDEFPFLRSAFTRLCLLTVGVALLVRSHLGLVVWLIVFLSIYGRPSDLAGSGLAPIRGFFSHRWIRWLGVISFPTYLLHEPVLNCALWVAHEAAPGMRRPHYLLVLAFVAWPMVLGISWLAHILIERPCIESARRWAAELPKQAAPTSALTS